MMRIRKRNRLVEYDYSTGGYYYVTSCVQDFQKILGNIINEQMILNEFGKIVYDSWLKLQLSYEYVSCDEFMVMPNHIHGILIINPSEFNSVGTGRDLSLQRPKIKSLSELIGVFKTRSSKLIHKRGGGKFKWQHSFYDRIIRNERELFNIRKYIQQNPMRWSIEQEEFENLDV